MAEKIQALTLYSSIGCHLCEEARAMLQHIIEHHQLSAEINEVDVLSDDDIETRYAHHIPVVAINGVEMGYPFTLPELEKWVLFVIGSTSE